jgi:hypothetical protein
MVKEPKRPWLAAMLAFFFGGPGFFYLGLRPGLIIPNPPLGSIDPEAVGLFLLQAATAWLAFRNCKRINAEAAKRAASLEPDPIQRAQANCAKEIRDVGIEAIALSGVTLYGSLMMFANTSPPMGEMGHFMHRSNVCLGRGHRHWIDASVAVGTNFHACIRRPSGDHVYASDGGLFPDSKRGHDVLEHPGDESDWRPAVSRPGRHRSTPVQVLPAHRRKILLRNFSQSPGNPRLSVRLRRLLPSHVRAIRKLLPTDR